MKTFDHEADGHLVLTTVGNDGVRWACRTCDGTVFLRDGRYLHFGERVSRQYVIELPVTVTVFGDGEVRHVVDAAGAGLALLDGDPHREGRYTEEQVTRDAETIDAEHAKQRPSLRDALDDWLAGVRGMVDTVPASPQMQVTLSALSYTVESLDALLKVTR